MEARSKKVRSLAIDSTSNPSKRPGLGDRHNSAPSVHRLSASGTQSKRASVNVKCSDTSKRNSKAGPRDDLESRPYASNRLSDRSKGSPHASRRSSRQIYDPDDITTFNFVVLGAREVGKSGFIRNALDLRRALNTPFAASKVSLGGNLYRIQLLELLFEDVDLTGGSKIGWPKYINNTSLPYIDGVFCLYDVTDKGSVADIPQALSAFSNTDTPHMLVACKTDAPEDDREIFPSFHEQIHRCYKDVIINDVSNDIPDSPKRCMLSILKQLLASSRDSSRRSSRQSSRSQSRSRPRRSNTQNSSRNASVDISRSRSRSQSQLRVANIKDVAANVPPVIESCDEENKDQSEDSMPTPLPKSKLSVDTANATRVPVRPTEPQTPESGHSQYMSQMLTPSMPTKSAIPETPESYYTKTGVRPETAESADSQAQKTFLNLEDESQSDSLPSEADRSQGSQGHLPIRNPVPQENGVPFDHLVNRLLLLPSSKQDSKFVPSFLCLYRCFATPKQLITAIIDRFMTVEKNNLVHFGKVAEQLRYLQVLGQWTGQYSGDFANFEARDCLSMFIRSLEKNKHFEHAAREINNNLQVLMIDDDADWAHGTALNGSMKRSMTNNKKNLTPPSTANSGSTQETDIKSPTTHGVSWELGGSDEDLNSANVSSHELGLSSSSTDLLRLSNTSRSHHNLQKLASARDLARRLQPMPHIRLSKIQWHQFMDTPVEELAREITRVDWAVYSSIRPRDFIRHVSLSEAKRRLRTDDSISVMVRQFNHLALFVSAMILLRDKPKHRAQALEKFMALAWKVRQLNNYNSLGAIVAGITGHEIARLASTRELVPAEVQKQFLRLTILMGTSKSHAAYRLAWENSSHERIPFLPLLRQDLTMAASVNQTFIGQNINWKKFEIMGDVVLGIQKSLEIPYIFPARTGKSDETIKVVLETKVLEEPEDSADPRNELYERSVQVEPQPGVDGRKKFEWLRR